MPLGHSVRVLILSNAAHTSLPALASGRCGHLRCFSTGNYHSAHNLWVLIMFFSSQLCCPLRFQGSPQTRQREFPGVWKLLSFLRPFLGRISIPTSFVSLFIFYIFSYLLLKTMGCFSGYLMSSTSIQELFFGIYSEFKYSFDEFVGKKVFSLSYSSSMLAIFCISVKNFVEEGLPRWHRGRGLTCQCRRHMKYEFDPWVRKIPWCKKWQPTPISFPGESHGQRRLGGFNP